MTAKMLVWCDIFFSGIFFLGFEIFVVVFLDKIFFFGDFGETKFCYIYDNFFVRTKLWNFFVFMTIF